MKKLGIILSLIGLIGCSDNNGVSSQPFNFDEPPVDYVQTNQPRQVSNQQSFDKNYQNNTAAKTTTATAATPPTMKHIERQEHVQIIKENGQVKKVITVQTTAIPMNKNQPVIKEQTITKKTINTQPPCAKKKQTPQKQIVYIPVGVENKTHTTPKVMLVKHDTKKLNCKKRKKCSKKTTQKSKPKTMQELLFDEHNKASEKLAHDEKIKQERIWLTKPISKEITTLSNGQTIEEELHETLAFLNAGQSQVCLDHPRLDFIKEAYQKTLASAQTCCRNNIASLLKHDGASDDAVYGFLINDYNFYRAGELCLFYSDHEIQKIFGQTITGRSVQTARNSCICQNKATLGRDIQIMRQIMHHPRLRGCPMGYQTVDEFGRYTNRNILNDLERLKYHSSFCPK